MDNIILSTKIAFASSFAFYLKASNYHWNVEGMFFTQLHELFGKIYEDVQENIDTFAEHIRTLDSYAPATFSRLIELSVVKDDSKLPAAPGMVENLLAENEKVIQTLNDAFNQLNAANMQGFANFIAERLDAHAKHGWMLRSTLKGR